MRTSNTTAMNFADLPLRVCDDAIYWQKLQVSPGASQSAVEEEVCVWRRDQDVLLTEDAEWLALAKTLLNQRSDNDPEMINIAQLVNLVKESNGDEEWAQYVATITNVHRPKLKHPEASPEMAYQQLVYPPVAGL